MAGKHQSVKKSKRVPKKIDDMLDQIHEMNDKALFPTGYELAVIGYVERFGMEPLVLVDRDKMLQMLVDEGMTYEESVEYYEFNIIGAWMGEGTPCFATLIK